MIRRLLLCPSLARLAHQAYLSLMLEIYRGSTNQSGNLPICACCLDLSKYLRVNAISRSMSNCRRYLRTSSNGNNAAFFSGRLSWAIGHIGWWDEKRGEFVEREQLKRLAQEMLSESTRLLDGSPQGESARRLDAACDYANRALELLEELQEDESVYGVIELIASASAELAVAKIHLPVPNRQVQVGGYKFSGYWRTWSRVLAVDHPEGPFVEVNLTPINSWAWNEDVRPIRVRAHCTAISRSQGDIFVHELPPAVRTAMVLNLGEELTDRLLTENFLPQIDWVLYRQKRGTGPGLDDIRLAQ